MWQKILKSFGFLGELNKASVEHVQSQKKKEIKQLNMSALLVVERIVCFFMVEDCLVCFCCYLHFNCFSCPITYFYCFSTPIT